MAVNVPVTAPAQRNQPWSMGVTLSIIVLFILVIALVGIFIPTSWRLGDWIAILILLALALVLLGRSVTGYWSGFLIDNRNKMSLARLQLGLWLILISSAFLAASLTNLHINMFSTPLNFSVSTTPSNPLSIAIPPEILAIFGVSATSLVGASAVLNVKNNNGQQIHTHDSRDQAHWNDMFKGDDAVNSDYVDLSKLQMFYITVIMTLVYGVALGMLFFGSGNGVDPRTLAITAFPSLSATMVTLLGISQGGYLVYKAVPRTSIQQPDQGDQSANQGGSQLNQ
jgi:hypothetical protein